MKRQTFSLLARSISHIGLPYAGQLLPLVFIIALGVTQAKADPGIPPPPVHQIIDANGVNLTSGKNQVAGPSITIGQPGSGGLTYTTTWQGRIWQGNLSASSVSHLNADATSYTVEVLGVSAGFTWNGSSFDSNDGMGATLVMSGSNYVYTARDGTVAVFSGANSFNYSIWTTVGLLTSLTYPSGETLTFTNQVISSVWYQLDSVNSNLGYQVKLFYNGSGFLTQVVALNNAVDYCSPSASSCSFSQSWPTLTFAYPSLSAGGRTTITDSNGNITDGLWQSTIGVGIRNRVTYPSGRYMQYLDSTLDNYIDSATDGTSTWQYTYTIGSDVVTRVTDPVGHIRDVTTDATSGVMTADTLDPTVTPLTTAFAYDGYNRVTQITYPESNKLQYTYDGRGNITQQTQVSKTPGTPANIVTTASFSGSCANPKTCNKPNSVTDPNSNTTSYTYDSGSGGIATITAPAIGGVNPQTRFTYSAMFAWYKNSGGSILQASSPVYRPVQTSQCMSNPPPGSAVWGAVTWGSFTWSGTSCIGSANEIRTTISYPSGSPSLATNLLPTSTTTGAGDGSVSSTISTTYDTVGNVASIDGPLSGSGDTTVFFYDGNRNQIGIVRPDPDGGGALANPATKVSYNADSQVLQTQQGTTPSQSWSDFNSNFTSLAQVTNGYDGTTGQKNGEASALGGTVQSITQYSFDAARKPLCTAVRQNASLFGSTSSPFGSLPGACSLSTSGTYGSDLITHNNYDAADRVTSIDSAYGTGSQQATVTNSYTANSKLDWVQDAKGNQSDYTYDGLDRLTQLNYPNSGDYEQYGYDANGNMTSRRLRDGNTIGYSYDALNRLTLKDLPGGSSSDVYLGYNLVGNPLYSHYASAGGSGVNYTWDALGRKTSETSYGRTIASQYDAAGNRTRLTYPDSNYIEYTYDVLSRMQQVKQNGSTVMVGYAYDNLGRTSSISRNNSATTTYSYNSTSQNWSLAQGGLSQNVTFGLTMTPAGQVYQRSISNSNYAYSAPALSKSYTSNSLNQYTNVGPTFTYDTRGNLTSDGARTLAYDLNNQLTSVTGSPNTTLDYDPTGRLRQTAGAATQQYLYDGDTLVVEYDGSGNILRRYVPGQGVDEPLVWYEGSSLSTPNWLHTDQQGSIVAASNSGATATTYKYSPAGEPSAWGASPSTPIYRYTGQAALSAIQLYYYKARMYDPAIGRFLQTDPIGYDGGMNLYEYAESDPVNRSDPRGLLDCPSLDCVTVRPGAGGAFGGNGDPGKGRVSPNLEELGEKEPPKVRPDVNPRNYFYCAAGNDPYSNAANTIALVTGTAALVVGGAAVAVGGGTVIVGAVTVGGVATGLGYIAAGAGIVGVYFDARANRGGNAAANSIGLGFGALAAVGASRLKPAVQYARELTSAAVGAAASSVCPSN